MAKIAMLVGDEYEDSEFQVPYDKLREAKHEVLVVGTQRGHVVKGKRGKSKIEIEATASEISPDEFDAVVIPGGHGPDKLRLDQAMVNFTRHFFETGKPLAAVCHGPQLLIEAKIVKGRKLTSWPSVRTDLINAGAEWVDQAVVVDDNLITSRKPDDLEEFTNAILERL